MNFWQRILDLFHRKREPISPPGPPPGPPPEPPPITQMSLGLFAMLNAERAKAGLQPFLRDPRLDASAQIHCNRMVATNTLAHQCPGEPMFDQRIQNAGYSHFSYVSENIAAGQLSPQDVVSDWMNEVPPYDGHREAILGPAKHCGCAVSYRQGTRFTWYWTADFASP